MEDRDYRVAFSKISITKGNFTQILLKYFGSLKSAWKAQASELEKIPEIKPGRMQRFIEKRKQVEPYRIIEELEKKNIKFITIDDCDYPYLLKNIYDPPQVLFIKGNLNECRLDRTIAIVGSRKASHYIKEVLKSLIGELKGSDLTIVSGMALGVDSCVHKVSIDNKLKTIAVLGCGVEYIYPTSNKKIYEEILNNNGSIISEYYPDQKAEIWMFPQRNRIISGLSKGTIIAEASLKSGALITARLCLEQNRELMCIPGSVVNPNTEGIYKIIKEGAAVVTKSQDIFDILNLGFIRPDQEKNDASPKILNKLLDKEKNIYKILELEPKTFDQILVESKLNINELLTILTTLELNGLIKQLAGQKYIKLL